MIRKHTRRAAKAAFAISLGVAIVIGLFAGTARSAPNAGPTVVIGTKNFAEEYILGQLYTQALKAKGFNAVDKGSFGSSELIQTALTSNKINFYPEYTGVIVQDVFHHTLSAKTAQGTYALAKKLEAAKGFTLFAATPFADLDVLAVTNATAAKYGLKSVADLKKVPGLSVAGYPEYQTRNTGLVGVKKAYGIDPKFVPLASISAYVLLDNGQVTAADVFTTDPPLQSPSKYTQLADPDHVSGFQNVAPIVSTTLADELGPKFQQTINAVSAKLTQPVIIALNKAVEVDKQSPAAVAKAFLKANGLV